MRLIDADEIVNTEFLYIKNKTVIEFLKDVVGGWNTVKAIPIEWIKEHYGWLTMAGEIIKEWEAESGADK